MQAIQVRKELTDEWDIRGIQKGVEYALLTDEISEARSGMTTRQFKNLKGLKKENLRDNMSTLELVLNMLAKATTTELAKAHDAQGLSENKRVAKRGGKVAGDARKAIESDTGKPVITSQNAVDFSRLISNMIEGSRSDDENYDKWTCLLLKLYQKPVRWCTGFLIGAQYTRQRDGHDHDVAWPVSIIFRIIKTGPMPRSRNALLVIYSHSNIAAPYYMV